MNLRAIAAKAAKIGFQVADSVTIMATVYSVPTITHDTATDASAKVWGDTRSKKALFYAAKEEKKDLTKPETVWRSCLLQGADFAGVEITQETEVDGESHRWKTHAVEQDPARGVIILTLYRNG